MIDISINKIYTLVTGLSVAGFSMLEITWHTRTADIASAQVKTAIEDFVKAGDSRNAGQLDIILNDNFRVVANRLMGSTTVSVMPKDQYLTLIREGKLGGDSRTIEILSLEVVNNNAAAHVRLKGKSMIFDTFYHLLQSPDGRWQLVQDLPFVTKNQN